MGFALSAKATLSAVRYTFLHIGNFVHKAEAKSGSATMLLSSG